MSSIAIQINSLHGCPSAHSFPSRKPISCTQSLVGFPLNGKPGSIFHSRTTPPSSRTTKFEAFAAPETMAPVEEKEEEGTQAPPLETERAEVVVKKVEKPRLVLKFIWMEKNIGLGLDQVIPGHGSVPLSPYFFWPRKDAWEELKAALESKPWISQKKMIILLNQATDIINLWQQSGGNLT